MYFQYTNGTPGETTVPPERRATYYHTTGSIAPRGFTRVPLLGRAEYASTDVLKYNGNMVTVVAISDSTPIVPVAGNEIQDNVTQFVGAGLVYLATDYAHDKLFSSVAFAFETGVPAYREGRRIGGDRPPFDVSSPLYRRIAGMAGLRHELTPLRRGRQIVRAAGDAPGLYAFSRMVEGSPGEVVVIFNTGLTPLKTRVAVDPASATWRAAHGVCPTAAAAPGVIEVEIAPLD
jgi:hypothetical protein